jgi:hypothetical protein
VVERIYIKMVIWIRDCTLFATIYKMTFSLIWKYEYDITRIVEYYLLLIVTKLQHETVTHELSVTISSSSIVVCIAAEIPRSNCKSVVLV